MKKVMLTILDGFGLRDEIIGNAVIQAQKPCFNYLWSEYPHSMLDASEEAVGLPKGQMGNSETGHLNIGAGRIVYQPLEYINNKIKTNEFYNNEELLNVMKYAYDNNKKITPLFTIEVKIKDRVEYLDYFKYDDPAEITKKFCQKYGLGDNSNEKILGVIEEKLRSDKLLEKNNK